jgi:DNA-binding protein HU-beta
MNKPDFITLVSEKMKVSKAEADKAVTGVFDALSEVLLTKNDYTHQGFGTFKTEFKESHQSRNPKTGESVTVPDRYNPKFSFSGSFKEKMKSVK